MGGALIDTVFISLVRLSDLEGDGTRPAGVGGRAELMQLEADCASLPLCGLSTWAYLGFLSQGGFSDLRLLSG